MPFPWEAARLLASKEAETPGRLPREMITQAERFRWTECGLQADLWHNFKEASWQKSGRRDSMKKRAKRGS